MISNLLLSNKGKSDTFNNKLDSGRVSQIHHQKLPFAEHSKTGYYQELLLHQQGRLPTYYSDPPFTWIGYRSYMPLLIRCKAAREELTSLWEVPGVEQLLLCLLLLLLDVDVRLGGRGHASHLHGRGIWVLSGAHGGPEVFHGSALEGRSYKINSFWREIHHYFSNSECERREGRIIFL